MHQKLHRVDCIQLVFMYPKGDSLPLPSYILSKNWPVTLGFKFKITDHFLKYVITKSQKEKHTYSYGITHPIIILLYTHYSKFVIYRSDEILCKEKQIFFGKIAYENEAIKFFIYLSTIT